MPDFQQDKQSYVNHIENNVTKRFKRVPLEPVCGEEAMNLIFTGKADVTFWELLLSWSSCWGSGGRGAGTVSGIPFFTSWLLFKLQWKLTKMSPQNEVWPWVHFKPSLVEWVGMWTLVLGCLAQKCSWLMQKCLFIIMETFKPLNYRHLASVFTVQEVRRPPKTERADVTRKIPFRIEVSI